MEAGSTKPAEVPSSCDGSTTMGCSSDLNRFDDPDDDPVDRLAGCKGDHTTAVLMRVCFEP